MKKKLGIIIVVIFLLIIGGVAFFGKSNTSTSSSVSLAGLPKFPVSSEQDIATLKAKIEKDLTYDIVNGDPDKYKGKIIEWGGKVFVEPEKDKDAIFLQIYSTDNDKPFVALYSNPDFEVKDGDYVLVTGAVKGKMEAENAFGAKLSRPLIEAGLIETGNRSQVLAKPQTIIPLNMTNTQNNFNVTLVRVELAKDETRAYLKVKNDSSQKISFYTYDTKLTQGSKQLEAKSMYDSGEELPSQILAGIEAEGVLIFPAIEAEPKDLNLFLGKPSGDDYSANWKDITFTFKLP